MQADAFGFPQWAVPVAQQNGLLHVALLLAALAAVYAIWRTVRLRDPTPLFVYLGAGASVLYEPLGDLLSKVAYPPLQQISLGVFYGRPLPLWMLPNYFFFFSAPVLLLLQFVVREGVSARKWFGVYAGLTVFVGIFEQPGIRSDAWRYYAATPAFAVHSYPIWVAFVNAECLTMIALGIFLLRRSLVPARWSFLFVLLVPMLLVGSHVAPTLPIFTASYATDDRLIINLAALLSIACCLLNVALGYLLLNRGRTQPAA